MFDLLHKWVSGSPTKYFPFIFALSAFLLKINFFLIGSVGNYQSYINWFSAPYPSYIQTFKRIREQLWAFPDIFKLCN